MNYLHNLPLLLGSAEGAAGGGGPTSMAPTLVTFGLVFAIFYFLIIRPQNKRQKETKSMLSALKKGDRVVTIGGIRGTIFSIKDDAVVLKVDDNTKIQFSRSAVGSVLEKKPSGKESAETAEETGDSESKYRLIFSNRSCPNDKTTTSVHHSGPRSVRCHRISADTALVFSHT